MPVPSAISDLSQTAGSNYPAGSESPTTADDYLRTYASYIAKLRDGQGFTAPVTLASATTTDIGGQVSHFVDISGTTTITSFGTNYNGPRYIRFTGALTLTHNATSLILPTGANITTVAGDSCIAYPNAALNGWTVVAYAGSSAHHGTMTIAGNTTLGDASTDTVTVNGYMGVGGAANTSFAINVVSSALTGTTNTGVNSQIVGATSATNEVSAYRARPGTAAAAYTVGNTFGLSVFDLTKGAGSTVTNQYGISVSDQTQGTNNYGVASAVSSGTNKWNIYASGTAANYFAGNVGIGTSSPLGRLDVAGDVPTLLIRNTRDGSWTPGETVGELNFYTNDVSVVGAHNVSRILSIHDGASGTTPAGALTFWTGANGVAATERLRIDSAGNVGVGTASPQYNLEVTGAASTNAILRVNGGSGANTNAVLDLTGRGSGSQFNNTEIRSIGAAANGGTLTFNTDDSSGVLQERLRIDSAGNLGLGGVTPSAWANGSPAIQIGAYGSLHGFNAPISTSGFIGLSSNAYTVSGSQQNYMVAQAAASYSQYLGQHRWYTAPSGTAGNAISFTQSLAVGNGTTLALEGATSAAGTGIAFPATQLASSNANTLDDYEEGTWTPSVGGTATYSFQGGVYTKVGRLVTVRGDLTINAIGTGSTTTISGLPFAAASDGFTNPGTVGYFSGSATSVTFLSGNVNGGTSTFSLSSLTAAGVTMATNAIFTAGTRVAFSATYTV